MKLIKKILPRIGVFIIDLLLFTCKIETIGKEEVEPYINSKRYIVASWHGRLILFFIICRHDSTAVMTSRSKDGAIAASMQISGGYKAFRGSTKKKGKDALKDMISYMKSNNRPAMLSIDGPTGPIYKAKPGISKLGSATNFPIIPVTFSGDRIKIFRSWDRCIIPKPFSRCVVTYGKPIFASRVPSDADTKKTTLEVENELQRITEMSDYMFNHKIN